MVKHFDTTDFIVENKKNNEFFSCTCYSTNTRNGFCHTCHIGDGITDTKISYYNRTWERYQFESVLASAIEKYNKVCHTHLTINDVKRI